ncbi:CMRF35-like molecule 2 [Dasypus novemcinctus]|uniref:CMRF35-like molecule 2 n=1 Tax=Dasypus novemcinctus TaxID=9361 RepID=UPI0003287E74|nr:CMRF35-like molecule 2 [Dasypus novemcinctus]
MANFCFTGYLTLSTPRILEATVGGILVVKCQYGVDDEGYGKFWCRGATWQDCARVIETEQLAEEEVVRRGRVTLRHIPSQRSFQVIVVDLEEGDAGTYWCGVDKPGSGPQAPVAVTVFPGLQRSLRFSLLWASFLLLAFLKAALLMGFGCAALWVAWLQRCL